MCGIAGWQGCDPDLSTNVLAAMATTLRHRGPDGHGMWQDETADVALAHLRLSIIDLSAANTQPMRDTLSGVVLAYNGEIYNFRALRTKLIARGYSFHTQGDTEVVLRAYLEWGIACLDQFAGMFAFALWDPRSQTMHLARDAMGMKPLYWQPKSGSVVFASEIKAFRSLPGFTPTPDSCAIQQYLEFGYVFDEQRTMLAGVRKLEPGTRLEIRAGRVAAHIAWFTPPIAQGESCGERERLEELRSALDEVVSQHLVADVPVGLLLSGGLDSSLIAALAARSTSLLTISMGFADSSVDERPQARAVSKFVGSDHVEVSITAQDVQREVAEGAWVFDDLFADWGAITTRLLYRRCREMGVKVVLVGEGSDEIFGGYDTFRVPGRLGLWQQFRLYQRYAGRRHGRLFPRFHAVLDEYLRACGGDAFEAVRLFESRRQLPNNYVMKVDKASMAESVEARAPFLDRRVAEIAYRTPREWLLRAGENKYLLRALARQDQLLPQAISSRPKFGASIAAGWMGDNEGFRRFARERLLDGPWTAALGLRRSMEAYFDRNHAGARFPAALSVYSNVAWRLLLLELWSGHYLKGHHA